MFKANDSLGSILTSITPVVDRFSPAPSFDAFCASFSEEDVKDWASLEADLSEAYACGDLPHVSAYVGHGPHQAPFIGIHAISDELKRLDSTIQTYFPELLRDQVSLERFRSWFVKRLDDPGFYHFVVHFSVSSDPEFVCFLWALHAENETAILHIVQGKVLSPLGLYLPSDLDAHRRSSAWALFSSYEGVCIGTRLLDSRIYRYCADNYRPPSTPVEIFTRPFPAGDRLMWANLVGALDTLPVGGSFVFYVQTLNESLRRLTLTLGPVPPFSDRVGGDLASVRADLVRYIEEFNHSLRYTSGAIIADLAVFEPLNAGAWGTLGAFCVIVKRPKRAA